MFYRHMYIIAKFPTEIGMGQYFWDIMGPSLVGSTSITTRCCGVKTSVPGGLTHTQVIFSVCPLGIVLQVIDFSNRAQDVERAVLEFAQPRRVRASRFEDVVSLSAELKAGLVNPQRSTWPSHKMVDHHCLQFKCNKSAILGHPPFAGM